MSLDSYIIRILQNEEVGPAKFELQMSKLTQVLDRHYKLREFISLCQAIEDRVDPQSKFHKCTVNQLCERFGVPRSTFYRKGTTILY